MSQGVYKKIVFSPGFERNDTSYGSEGHWVKGDKVRFRDEGRPEKMGGWERFIVSQKNFPSINTFTGCVRKLKSWVSLNGNKYLALGSHEKLELMSNGEYYDITPTKSEFRNIPVHISTFPDSRIVSIGGIGRGPGVPVFNHLSNVGDVFTISFSSPLNLGTISIAGEYRVTSVFNPTQIFAEKTRDNTLSNAVTGVDVVASEINFILSSGNCDSTQTTGGWGIDTWGTSGISSGGWGDPRGNSELNKITTWSLDTFGEDLIANRREGGIYSWDASSGLSSNRATLIPNAPAKNNFIFVSDVRRNIVSLGCSDLSGVFDPLLVRWSDTENRNQWDPSVPNSVSGSIRLSNGSELISGLRTKNQNIIFTDTATYSMQFVGGDTVYSFQELGTKSGIIAPNAAQEAEGTVYWMGRDSFFVYDGIVRPLECSLQKDLFNPESEISLNISQKDKIYAGFNREFSEIIWLYPSKNSIECNRYIIYNYLFNTWYDGTLDRTAWEDKGIFEYPVATSSNNFLFSHEKGKNADGNLLYSCIESSFFDIEDGTEIMFIDSYIPDFRKLANTINFTITTKKYINPESEKVTKGPYPIDMNTDKVNFRARGRQAKVKYEINTTDGDFEVGAPRLRIMQDGMR